MEWQLSERSSARQRSHWFAGEEEPEIRDRLKLASAAEASQRRSSRDSDLSLLTFRGLMEPKHSAMAVPRLHPKISPLLSAAHSEAKR